MPILLGESGKFIPVIFVEWNFIVRSTTLDHLELFSWQWMKRQWMKRQRTKTATDWPKCFCIYSLKCSKAISGWSDGWTEISGRPYSKSTCGTNNIFCRDEISCPEYERWKEAFLVGGYLPYNNALNSGFNFNQFLLVKSGALS